MNIKLHELAKDSLIYVVVQWISKLGSLLLVPILSRIFVPSDYGKIDLLNNSYLFALMLVSLNIDSGVQKHYFLREGEDRKQLLTSTLLFRLIITSVAAILAIVFSKPISLLAFQKDSHYLEICLLAATLPIDDIFNQLVLLLRLNRKAFSFGVYSLSQLMIQPVLTYICVVPLGLGLVGVFVAKLGTTLLLSIPLMYQQRHNYMITLDLAEAVRIAKFSIPGLPAILQINIMQLLPRYLLVYYSNLSAVGYYSIADRIAHVIEMFRGSFDRAWNPFAFSNAGQPDEKYLYEKVFRLFALCLLLLVTVVSFFAGEIFAILTPPSYHSASILVGGVALYYCLRSLPLIFATGLYSCNKVSHTSLLATVQLLTFVPAAVFLASKYNAAGLVLALDISAFVFFVCYGWTIKKYFSFSFSSWRLIAASAVAFAAICCIYRLPGMLNHGLDLSIIFSKSLLFCAYLLLCYFVVITKEERAEVSRRIRLIRVSSASS